MQLTLRCPECGVVAHDALIFFDDESETRAYRCNEQEGGCGTKFAVEFNINVEEEYFLLKSVDISKPDTI